MKIVLILSFLSTGSVYAAAKPAPTIMINPLSITAQIEICNNEIEKVLNELAKLPSGSSGKSANTIKTAYNTACKEIRDNMHKDCEAWGKGEEVTRTPDEMLKRAETHRHAIKGYEAQHNKIIKGVLEARLATAKQEKTKLEKLLEKQTKGTL